MENNPFLFGPPVIGDQFYGRGQVIREILSLVERGQPCSILGERRIGKTSLLLNIARHRSSYELRSGTPFFPIYLDLQGYGDLTEEGFWRTLLDQAILEASGSQVYSVLLPLLEDALTGDLEPRHVKRLAAKIGQAGFRLLLLFDEFEYVADSFSLDLSFFGTLRSLVASNLPVGCVTASQKALSEIDKFRSGYSFASSPFWNVFTTIRLGVFQEQEASDFIRGTWISQGRKFDDESFDFLYDLSGFHPFFLQAAAYYLFEETVSQNRAGAESRFMAQKRFATQCRGHFDYYWTNSSEAERKALKILAQSQHSEEVGSQRHPRDIAPASVIHSLLDRALLVPTRGREGVGFSLFSTTFGDWIREITRSKIVREDKLTPSDFKQIPLRGRRFEQLVIQLLEAMGFGVLESVEDGTDEGDIIATLEHPIEGESERLLVACRHFAHTGKAVGSSDVDASESKLNSCGANGFLLVTSTRVTASLDRQLRTLGRGDSRRAEVWDVDRVIQKLDEYPAVRDAFFEIPKGRQRALSVGVAEATLEVESDGEVAAYCSWAYGRYEQLRLVGVGGGDVNLRLAEVYVPLGISRPALSGLRDSVSKRRGELALEREESDVELEQIFGLKDGTNLHRLVLGEPGAGKTTALLKLHQHCLTEGAESLGLEAGTIPIFLPLRKIRDLSVSLGALAGEYLQEASGGEFSVDLGLRLWRRGRLLLLLDGLDEVADNEKRAKIATYLEWQLGSPDAGQMRAVVSCRYAGYGDSVRFNEGFLALDVRPLDGYQVRRLVRQWFREVQRVIPGYSEEEALRHARELLTALEGEGYASQQLKVLVSSPLLLTLMCVVVLRGGEMPRRRVEFYDQCLRVLLGTWHKAKGIESLLDIETALALLRPLAWDLHVSERRDDLSRAEFVNYVRRRLRDLGRNESPFRVVEWIHRETGVIAEYAPHRYGFIHLSLQEYLAAAHATRLGDELLDHLAHEFGERWWREVILLLVALSGRQVFGSLMSRVGNSRDLFEHADLIRECLSEAQELDLRPFLDLLRRTEDPTRQAAVLRLVRGRCDEILRDLVEELTSSSVVEVATLALQVLEECQEVPKGGRPPAFDFFLVHHPADQELAQKLASILVRRGIRLFGEKDWQADLENLLSNTWGVAALVGPEGGSPWKLPELGACLELFDAEKRPLVPVLLPGIQEVPELPASLRWLPWVDLRDGLETVSFKELERTASGTKVSPIAAMPRTEKPVPGEPFRDSLMGMRFLWIPGGRFRVGDDRLEGSSPVHWVRLSAYWLSENPVTNRQYALFLDRTSHREPKYWRRRRFSGADQPVVGVSWHDATTFCNWLSQELKMEVRLPTEAQWEFAARGTDERQYVWGNSPPDSTTGCFAMEQEDGHPNPVGSYPSGRGPFGTLDQAGNVWEWCLDIWNESVYEMRSKRELVDPLVTEGNMNFRVLRGGSWRSTAESLRAAYRGWLKSSDMFNDIGFRVSISQN